MQEEAMPSSLIQGASECRQFTSGTNLPGAHSTPRSLRVDLGSARSPGGDIVPAARHLRIRMFHLHPAGLPFRPPRVTAKPTVRHAISRRRRTFGRRDFTDKYGRVKVQFHWDREGKNSEKVHAGSGRPALRGRSGERAFGRECQELSWTFWRAIRISRSSSGAFTTPTRCRLTRRWSGRQHKGQQGERN